MSELKKKYSWSQFEKDVQKISAWAGARDFKNIYGIPRGGLVLAVKLSHILEIPVILDRNDISRDTLVVDDIIDKGVTLKRFLSSFGVRCCVASIFLTKTSEIRPTFFVREKNEKPWIIFPWETKETSRYDRTV